MQTVKITMDVECTPEESPQISRVARCATPSSCPHDRIGEENEVRDGPFFTRGIDEYLVFFQFAKRRMVSRRVQIYVGSDRQNGELQRIIMHSDSCRMKADPGGGSDRGRADGRESGSRNTDGTMVRAQAIQGVRWVAQEGVMQENKADR